MSTIYGNNVINNIELNIENIFKTFYKLYD